MQAQTPLLKQYFECKANHPGIMIAMRVGDFYEFYGEDAELAAQVLEITLTGREDGSNGRIPMAGVPFHALEKYAARLLKRGHKVGICDQLEDPKKTKGLIKRDITRVLTAGTVLEDSMLSAKHNNFLAAVCVINGKTGLATLDPSTGEFQVTEIPGEGSSDRFFQELSRLQPSELLIPEKMDLLEQFVDSSLETTLTQLKAPHLEIASKNLKDHFNAQNLQAFGCADQPSSVIAASMVLSYLKQNGLPAEYIQNLSTYSTDSYMSLDLATKRSLEITQNLSEGQRAYTLFEILDQCSTVMGSRLLRRWLDQPLLNINVIQERLDAIDKLMRATFARGLMRDNLKKLSDVERLASRVATGLAGPRDLVALRVSLKEIPSILRVLTDVPSERLSALQKLICAHDDLVDLLQKAIIQDPPHTLREGGVIAEGFDLELDELRMLSQNAKQYVANLEQKEREASGIPNLKVGFNSVFGYYLEVSKIHSSKVPQDYIRKQTTANAERYITAELKEHEAAILGAQQKAQVLEVELFQRVRTRVAEHCQSLLQTARALAELDVLADLAQVSIDRHYVKPEFVSEDILEIESGRHPVVESYLRSFVPNDLSLDASPDQGNRTIVLTGPNMSGKSTYLRQSALIILMAQIGCFVPAKSCRMGLCDRIFARIGAKDELALGQSTFMVEMVESANILNHATSRSFVILDEIGRGTSTYDGLAIAWSMTEYLAKVGCKMMFATHYHQLNTLADQIPGIANYRVSVEEVGDQVIWTHRVLAGGTDRSYGIHVARMAGAPLSVVQRAQQILDELEQNPEAERVSSPSLLSQSTLQLKLFEPAESELQQKLELLDLQQMTPMQALQTLDEWKSRYCGLSAKR